MRAVMRNTTGLPHLPSGGWQNVLAARCAARVHVDAERDVERYEEADYDQPLIRKALKRDQDHGDEQGTLDRLPELQALANRLHVGASPQALSPTASDVSIGPAADTSKYFSPIPGASRSEEPGAHKRCCLRLKRRASKSNSGVYGSRTWRCAPIREWEKS